MYTKYQMNDIFEKIAATINISEEMFDKAENAYTDMNNMLDKNTKNYNLQVYPQGSFALGTVIKPLTENDEYDLDLVCEFEKDYGLSAKEIKVDIVKPLLEDYSKVNEIEEKRRCWQVIYENLPNFHMDIIPAVNMGSYIHITDKDEDKKTYDFLGSNPKDYIKWFHERSRIRYDQSLNERVVIKQDIKKYHNKTPLQKTIQILKRHRDIMFQDDSNHLAPVSIIITTIAKQIYKNEDNIYDTLKSFLLDAKSYVLECKKDNEYYIENPSHTGDEKENFADKWNEYPKRADAFFEWIENAKQTLIDSFININNENDLINIIGSSIGDSVAKRSFPAPVKINSIIERIASCDTILPLTEKTTKLLHIPYKEKPPWVLPKGCRAIINAKTTDTSGIQKIYKNDGEAIPKGFNIEFSAMFGGVSKPYNVKWQIVNTGIEAENAKCLRGNMFEDSDVNHYTRRESTSYKGSHTVQCFVIKKNKCVAKSDIFIVNIQ